VVVIVVASGIRGERVSSIIDDLQRREATMPYVVTATWRAKPGEEPAVLERLQRVAAASRQEPGCILFLVHRSVDDPAHFFLYEQYESEEAFRPHAASVHVREIVLQDAVHRLETRERAIFEMIPAATPATS
jgi:quinol monooxygenase YgiN